MGFVVGAALTEGIQKLVKLFRQTALAGNAADAARLTTLADVLVFLRIEDLVIGAYGADVGVTGILGADAGGIGDCQTDLLVYGLAGSDR